LNQLYWLWKNNAPAEAIKPRIKLYDNQNPVKIIYRDFSGGTVWGSFQIGVGYINIELWGGDTCEFNWNLTEIRFEDIGSHPTLDESIIRLDGLYFFKSGGYYELHIKDQVSTVSKRKNLIFHSETVG